MKWLQILMLTVFLPPMMTQSAEPMRLLVDKVFSRNPSKDLREDDFAAIKKAGFNTVSNRWHGDNPEKTAEYIKLCRKQNLDYLPWLRGTVETGDAKQQLVYENGIRLPIAAPLSEDLWKYLEHYLAGYAKMSKELPNLIGAFLDFEVYSKKKYTNAYPVSYDDAAWNTFLTEQGRTVPSIPFAERPEWLRQENLFDRFHHWTEEVFQLKAKRLRETIDRINPNFQLIVYNGDFLITDHFIPAMSTDAAPTVIAASNTYGPPCPLLPEADNIEMASTLLVETARERFSSLPTLGGIDPVETGCIPEYAGKFAVEASRVVDGYWVFYEGFPKESPRHAEYMHHFGRANRAIMEKDFAYARAPFQSTDLKPMQIPPRDNRANVAVYGGKPFLFATLEALGYQPVPLTRLEPEILAAFDLVILQNFNVIVPEGGKLHKILQDYVRNGGGLLLAHDTGWFLRRLFPTVAERGFPKEKVSNTRHVLDLEMLANGKPYRTAFADHAIFVPGPSGRVLVRNRFGEAVAVAGAEGKGMVIYAGNYFAYAAPLEGEEKSVFAHLLSILQQK